MPSTTFPRPPSSRPSNFARDAVFAAFGPRRAHAIDQGDFIDRAPAQLPRRPSKPNTSGEDAENGWGWVRLPEALDHARRGAKA